MNEKHLNVLCKTPLKYIKTGIKFLDDLGGIPRNEITEICGPPGAGKTLFLGQIAFYHCMINPRDYVIFFDADKTLHPERFIHYCDVFGINCDKILNHIFLYDVESSEDIIATANRIKQCSLVIIDSVPSLFREKLYYDNKFRKYLRELVRFGIYLRKITKHTTVVLSNQIRAVVKKRENNRHLFSMNNTSETVPALGAVWEEFVDNRLIIRKMRRDLRIFISSFSSSYPETFGLVKFSNEIFY